MEHVDVAIVGGGPGGTSAAHAAARHGADAVVLEKGVPRADRGPPGPRLDGRGGDAGLLGRPDGLRSGRGVPRGRHPQRTRRRVVHRPLRVRDAPLDRYRRQLSELRLHLPPREVRRLAPRPRGRTPAPSTASASASPAWRPINRTSTLTASHWPAAADLEADFLILADGPQRTITARAVGQFLPGEETLSDRLPSTEANHIAYQEHRRMPEEIVPRGHHRLLVGRDAGPHRLPVDLPERR